MSATVPLSVAIYENPGIKHWSLYIETEEDRAKTIVHILGARHKYFREIRTPSNARESKALVDMCPLCEIDAAKITTVKNIALATPIRNEESDYSCQDFVLDVLEQLEIKGVIMVDDKYKANKMAIRAKRERWQ